MYNPRRFELGLLLTALAGAAPRIWFGSSQFVEYDGYWHVFIAQQDNWANFWQDVAANAHPPLYFLLLRTALVFGRSLLVYRAISLATGIVSIYLLGRIARRMNLSPVFSWLAALGFAAALPAIIIACEVRSYMLCVFFVLWSFWYFLDLLEDDNRAKTGARAGFAALSIAACLSHYFAFFYIGVCAAVLIGRGAFLGIRRGQWTGLWRHAGTVVPVVGAAGVLYVVHARRLARIQQHLAPYYYDPAASETVGGFLVRNAANFFNLFSPVGPLPQTAAAWGFAGCIAVALCALAVLVRGSSAADRRAAWSIGVGLAMLAGMVAAAVAGKYPFGGDLRQQFLIFPFILLGAAVVLDRIAARGGRGPKAAVAALAAAAIVASGAVRLYAYPKVRTPMLAERMAAFDRVAPAPRSVYVDQFNLILFFQFHDQWRWRFVGHAPGVNGIDVYDLTNGTRRLRLFRDTLRWNLDPSDGTVYDDLARLLRSQGGHETAIFCVFTDQKSRVQSSVLRLAGSHDLCVGDASLNRKTWFSVVHEPPCDTSGAGGSGVRVKYGNESDELEYKGTWTYGQYPSAPESVVFSNQAGASVALRFTGTGITYVYTTTYNGGLASVNIDGVERETIDEYSPGIVWQHRRTWGNLGPGEHTLQVNVLGRKNPASTDAYVFLESLVVH